MLVTGFHRVKQIDYRYNWEPGGRGGGGGRGLRETEVQDEGVG